MVTDPAHRGARLAGHLIDAALDGRDAPGGAGRPVAPRHVYARHGFAPDGAEFLDDGIPHTPMRLRLDPP